jgi:aldose 1-epimerase
VIGEGGVADPSTEARFVLARDGVTIEVIGYGARLARCLVPDRNGQLADVVPGFDNTADYIDRAGSIGAVLGRYANRIGYGRIELHGRSYELSRNDGAHAMHGGQGHFGTRFWQGQYLGGDAVRLTLSSPDGDQGWPGNVEAAVVYRLTDGPALEIEMTAVSDQDTYLNLIFHGYWNLAGHGSGTVCDHLMMIAADYFTPRGSDDLPTGLLESVEGTPLDFRTAKPIGRDIAATGKGYVHNLCLNDHREGVVRPVVRLLDPASGRAIDIATDQPGLQVFTGNSWSGLAGKAGALYRAHDAIALETQLYPNTPNTPSFNPVPVRAGEMYRHRMLIGFHALEPRDYAAFLEGKQA